MKDFVKQFLEFGSEGYGLPVFMMSDAVHSVAVCAGR